MSEQHQGCLDRSASSKEAGAVVYLMEELGDARMRCDQLLRRINEGLKLIEKSSHRDAFFEIAGHLIQNIPVVAFKLQKALDATALAASRIDYEELKRGLRPEKVLELETVLEDVRIRQVEHRSEPLQALTPRHAAEALRRVAWMTRGESGLPQYEVSRLVTALEAGLEGSGPEDVSEGLERLADALEGANDDAPNRTLVASTLRRLLGDALVKDFQKTERRIKMASKLSQEMLQLSDEKEVRKKFKEQNPDVSEADLKEIVKMWEEHKDALKTATDWKTPTAAGRPTELRDIRQMEDLTGPLTHEGETRGEYLFTDGYGELYRYKAKNDREAKMMDRYLGFSGLRASDWKADEARQVTAGRPKDPTLARVWTYLSDVTSDLGSLARGLTVDGLNSGRIEKEVREIENTAQKALDLVGKLGSKLRHEVPPWMQTASDDDKKSRFEEGKSADPTKNMSPEDAKKWKAENDKNKDKFKKDADWKVDAADVNVGRLERMVDNTERQLKEMKAALAKYKSDPGKMEPQLKNLASAAKSIMTTAKMGLREMGWKLASDDDKKSRFEEGKPADPTKNMSPEDKKKWEAANEKHKDKFKSAASWKA